MINFRFHLISLVAVFLALGIGVAAGASFVDRATVESLQGRVEDLDSAYRDRGVELDLTREELAVSDRQAAALAGDGSVALDGSLEGQPVTLLVSDGVPAELLNQVRTSLAAAGVVDPAIVRVLPAAAVPDEIAAERIAAAIGLTDADVSAEGVRDAVVATLAAALARLSGPAPTTTDPETPAPLPVSGSGTDLPADAAAAVALLERLDQLGVVSVESPSGIALASFGGGTGTRFLELLTPTDDVSSESVMVPLAEELSAAAPGTLTVGVAGPPRPEGGIATTSTVAGAAPTDPLSELRSPPSSERLSTVDDVGESFGRIAAVYAVAEQRRSGNVGAYGTGPGVVGPFPTTPSG